MCGHQYAVVKDGSALCPNINCSLFNKEYLSVLPLLIKIKGPRDRELKSFFSKQYNDLVNGIINEPDQQHKIRGSHPLTKTTLLYLAGALAEQEYEEAFGEYKLRGDWSGSYYAGSYYDPPESPEWELNLDYTEYEGEDILKDAVEIRGSVLTELGWPMQSFPWPKVVLLVRLVSEVNEPEAAPPPRRRRRPVRLFGRRHEDYDDYDDGDDYDDSIMVMPYPKTKAEETRDEWCIATPAYEIIDDIITDDAYYLTTEEGELVHRLTLHVIDAGVSRKYDELIDKEGAGGMLFVRRNQI